MLSSLDVGQVGSREGWRSLPVRFASRAFTPAESRWTTTHQELFAVKWGLEQFRSYILGHENLKWLTTMAPQQAKVAK